MKTLIDFINKNVVLIGSILIALIAILIMSKKMKSSSTAQTQSNTDTGLKFNSLDGDINKNLGQKNNNYGNLRPSSEPWQGQTGTNKGFVVFSSVEYGLRAMIKTLWTYYNSHGLTTIEKIVNRYAPAADSNNPTAYADFVAKDSGIPKDKKLDFTSRKDYDRVISAMCQMESETRPTKAQLEKAWQLA